MSRVIFVKVRRPIRDGEPVFAEDVDPTWRAMETPEQVQHRATEEENGRISYYANLHDSSCAGRVCLNPEHMPDAGSVIDVQPQRKERLRLTDGKDDDDQH